METKSLKNKSNCILVWEVTGLVSIQPVGLDFGILSMRVAKSNKEPLRISLLQRFHKFSSENIV